jgi:acyl carrier protein
MTLQQILAETTGEPPSTFTPDYDLRTCGGIDSLDWMEIAMRIEDTFEIDFGADPPVITTVGKLQELIDQLRGNV